jgi:hypothetical protein
MTKTTKTPQGRVKFYLGSHEPSHLATARVPLFVSHRRLSRLKTLRPAAEVWALDSGGFSELSLYGEWRTTPAEYVAAVRRYDEEIGRLEWAAPMDMMCEAPVIAKTGLTITEHQKRTVVNFIELCELWDSHSSDCPFMPVLQGQSPPDYVDCMDLYEAAGVRLADYPLVGVGSVCRRQHTAEIAEVLTAILDAAPGTPLHGYGCKTLGLRRYGHLLTSADSLGWSYRARYADPLPGHTHKACVNCLEFALRWRRNVVGGSFCTHHQSHYCPGWVGAHDDLFTTSPHRGSPHRFDAP